MGAVGPRARHRLRQRGEPADSPRSMRRRGEIATRLALGAPRGRIARQLLTEAVLIWCLGGLVGWAVAFWGRELLWSFRPPFLAADAVDLSLDWRVLGFTLVVTLATGVLFGLAPALRAARTDLITSLRLRAGDGSDERGGLGAASAAREWAGGPVSRRVDWRDALSQEPLEHAADRSRATTRRDSC